MFTIPDGATTDQIVALCIAHQEAERSRLLVEYRPCPEDFPIDPSEWGTWGPEPYEPSAVDLAFLAALPPICGGAPEPDYEAMAAAAECSARLELSHQARELGGPITDADVALVTGCAG